MTPLTDLRKLAMEATKGKWISNSTGIIMAYGTTDTYCGAVLSSIICCEDTEMSDGEGRNWSTSGTKQGNAAYLSAANPSQILVLLDVIEKVREALALSKKLCGSCTSDVCDDTTAITVNEALQLIDSLNKSEGKY